MVWLVRRLEAWHAFLERPEAAHWNAVIVFYLLWAIASTLDLTRPAQPFDYVRF